MSAALDLCALQAALAALEQLPARVGFKDRADGVMLLVDAPLGLFLQAGSTEQEAIDRLVGALKVAA